jgi:hypothetical protein
MLRPKDSLSVAVVLLILSSTAASQAKQKAAPLQVRIESAVRWKMIADTDGGTFTCEESDSSRSSCVLLALSGANNSMAFMVASHVVGGKEAFRPERVEGPRGKQKYTLVFVSLPKDIGDFTFVDGDRGVSVPFKLDPKILDQVSEGKLPKYQ